MNEKIGFIGLGIMGKPMAKNLLKAGKKLVVFDVNRKAVDELTEYGAKAAGSGKEIAEQTEIIFTMLPNSPHVRTALLGENGVLEGLQPGAIVVDMSSIAPGTSAELCEKVREKGGDMLDAPVSGGEPKAIDGSLAIMVGGREETFGRVKNLLEIMGGSVTLVGEIGSGNVTKLANQIMVALHLAAMSEAFVLATKTGVDPEKVFDAIKGGLAGSTVLNAKIPMVLDRNFKPGFRIELHIKDLMNAMETAHAQSVPLPLTGQVLEMMEALKVSGSARDDHSGLIRYYEGLAGVEVRRQP